MVQVRFSGVPNGALVNLVPFARTLIYATAATLSAVLSDWVIENSAARGVFGSHYVEHDQRSIVCTLTAGAIFLLMALLLALAEKFGSLPQGPRGGDWLVEAAHDISHRWSWRALGQSLAIALAVRYAMESTRVMHLHGHAANVFDWLGAPTILGLGIHGFFCTLTFFCLIRAMRGLDRALEKIVRFVVAIFVTLARTPAPTTHRVARDAFGCRTDAALLARLFGDRAPPLGCCQTP